LARIALILRPDRGGAFAHVAALATDLAERGHDVAVFGPLDPARPELAAARVVPVPMIRPVDPRADVRTLAALARALRKFKPDLIHAHGSKGGVLARLARAAQPRVPLVFTPHLYAFDNYFTSAGQRRLYRAIERALAPLATRVIAVCEAERRNAASVGPASRVRVVHNGVDPVRTDEVHPVVAELREAHGFVACAVAELRDSKGIDTLLRAFAQARREDRTIGLAIAGDGAERASLEALARSLELGDAVRFLGATPGPDAVLAGADAFVNAAYAEAFPYTVIEAMSGGVPVIATDVGGTAEAIGRRGEAGVLIPPRDAGALTGALLELARDPERRAELGARARAEYERRFTRERMLAGIRAVYAEIGVS